MHFDRLTRSVTGIGLLLALAIPSVPAQQKADPGTGAPQLEQAIHDYLMAHPEVMLESIRQFQQQAQLEKKQKAKDVVASHRRDLEDDQSSPVLQAAHPSADPITVVEFFDYRCGYCKKVDSQIVGLTSSPGVRIIYKDFPILGDESLLASKAALAAAKQGKYHEFHHALITGPSSITMAIIDQVATALSLDLGRLHADMEGAEIKAQIDQNLALAQTLGVQSTPTFVIGENVLPGALTDQALQSALASARDRSKPAAIAAHAGGL